MNTAARSSMQSEAVFDAALGVSSPWYVRESVFDAKARTLTIGVDFRPGSRFGYPGVTGEHPAHDTQTKRYRHLNFFQHECFLEVRVPRVKLPDGAADRAAWAGKLSRFTLLFEALVFHFPYRNARDGFLASNPKGPAAAFAHFHVAPRASGHG